MSVITKKIKEMSLVRDKFHFRNHIGRWCKANCNPFTSTELEVNVYLNIKLKKNDRLICTPTSPVIIIIVIYR